LGGGTLQCLAGYIGVGTCRLSTCILAEYIYIYIWDLVVFSYPAL